MARVEEDLDAVVEPHRSVARRAHGADPARIRLMAEEGDVEILGIVGHHALGLLRRSPGTLDEREPAGHVALAPAGIVQDAVETGCPWLRRQRKADVPCVARSSRAIEDRSTVPFGSSPELI